MSNFNIDCLTLRNMARLIYSGELTSYEISSHYLKRIKIQNKNINAIINKFNDSEILEDSKARVASDIKPLSKLYGVPLTIKDVCHIKGFKMSRGVKELYGHISDKDATVVQRLRAEGAVILGVTNVPEMCMAFETDNLLYGRTNNPYQLDKSAGGSSGGEAAAIASGMSPGGLASDACGSVRLPAHFNGVVGLKLTQWRVPLTGQFPIDRSGLFHFTSSFSVMGRYVDDVALLAEIISGPDGYDPDTVPSPWYDYRDIEISDLNVGFWKSEDIEHNESIENNLTLIKSKLASVTKSTKWVSPPLVSESIDVMWKLFILGGSKGRNWDSLFKKMNKLEFSEPISKLLEMASDFELSVDQLRNLFLLRDQVRSEMLRFFEDLDVLICPVYPDVAFNHGESFDNINNYKYLLPFSLTGQPAVVIPVGICPRTKLPIGLQIVGRSWEEHIILSIASHIEQLMPKWEPKLKIFNNVLEPI